MLSNIKPKKLSIHLWLSRCDFSQSPLLLATKLNPALPVPSGVRQALVPRIQCLTHEMLAHVPRATQNRDLDRAFFHIAGHLLKAGHGHACPLPPFTCHPERSEGSLTCQAEILRFAQDDK